MCDRMRQFRDQRSPDTLIPLETLIREYGEEIVEGTIDPCEKTFQQYLAGCMESAGGTLSEVFPCKAYAFMIRETLTMRVEVDAPSFLDAKHKVEQLYDAGEYNLDHNCFAGVEFRSFCSYCGSDFDAEDQLREVDEHTADARVLCDQCVADLEDRGTLTRCECCEDLFASSRLKTNPSNGTREICPLCGEIWCE